MDNNETDSTTYPAEVKFVHRPTDEYQAAILLVFHKNMTAKIAKDLLDMKVTNNMRHSPRIVERELSMYIEQELGVLEKLNRGNLMSRLGDYLADVIAKKYPGSVMIED